MLYIFRVTKLYSKRYWEARTKIMEKWPYSFSISIFCDYSLSL